MRSGGVTDGLKAKQIKQVRWSARSIVDGSAGVQTT